MPSEPIVAEDNEEAQEAWNGVLFDRFVAYRDLIVAGLEPHGAEALRRHPPQPGDRALDIGCGFGDTACRLAEMVGPEGEVLGVDVAPRFIDAATQEAKEAGVENVRFEVADLQVKRFEETFDYAYARCGTMFFALPGAAMRNVAQAMAPGGRLCIVVWRRKLDNPWLHRAENVVKEYLPEPPEETDEPRCGPGPFSMANADTVAEILVGAGFTEVAFERVDIPILIGHDLDEAVAMNSALGPAAEAIRLAGASASEIRPRIEADLRAALADLSGPDGVCADASTWTVTARVS